MIHYTCDRCQRTLDSSGDLRYVVKLEIYAAMEPLEVDQAEDDRDHLVEIQEILERLEAGQSPEVGQDVYQKQRYDLCPDCYRRYIRNPLGSEVGAEFGFSPN
jgi:hypothetical protein